jgi:two-component system, response regulator YesN
LTKLMIIDDDHIMREGLSHNIPWEKHNFLLVATAADGEEGLELIKIHQPQIVLTDIRMPFMNGLQLAERIKKEFPEIKIIFLTAYDDFEYAHKALKLKVNDYILKWEENEEILNKVIKARDELLNEAKIAEQINKSRFVMRKEMVRSLLLGLPVEGHNLSDNFDELDFRDNFFTVVVISVGGSNRTNAGIAECEMALVLNISETVLSKYQQNFLGVNIDQNSCILLNLPDDNHAQIKVREPIFQELKCEIEKSLEHQVMIAVGNIYEGLENVSITYREAIAGINLRNVLGSSSVILYKNLKEGAISHQVLIKKIINYVDENYEKETISLNDLAVAVYLSPNYISSLFKKYRNITFSEYLIKVRMDKAQDLLKYTDLKTYEVAEKIGYTNSQYFSVLFKQTTGYTPTEYKKLNLIRRNEDNT